MVALTQTNHDLSESISLLGEMFMYVCGGDGSGEFVKQRKRLERATARRKTLFYHQIKDPKASWTVAPLACSLIIVIINVRSSTRTHPQH